MSVFTPEYIATIGKRWSSTPKNGQPLIARIATDRDREDDRERIESWVARLHPDDRLRMTDRIRNKDHFITAYGELMTAQVLRNAGLPLRYEPELTAGGRRLTPDWMSEGDPTLMCDAFTAGCADDRDAHETSLQEIEERLKKLPYAGMIRIEIVDAAVLDAGDRKRLVHDISSWLATRPTVGEKWYGSEMLVEMMVVGGSRLDIMVSDPIHQVETPASVADNFALKAKRYGVLQLPLIVAAVKHPRAEIHDIDVEDVLLGRQVYVSGETRDGRIIGGPRRLPDGVLATRPEISAAIWIYPYSLPAPRVQVWANPAARVPLPQELREWLSTATL